MMLEMRKKEFFLANHNKMIMVYGIDKTVVRCKKGRFSFFLFHPHYQIVFIIEIGIT